MSKKDIEALVEQCRDLGWGIEPTARGFHKLLPPQGDPIITPSTSHGRALANFKSELRKAGFNPDTALHAKLEKAQEALAEDMRRNEEALARANQRIADDNPDHQAPGTALATPLFVAPVSLATNLNPHQHAELQVTAGYPTQSVIITQAYAAELLATLTIAEGEDKAPQRPLYYSDWGRLQQAMELGEWELNPVDSLVLDEKGRLINGQHRMKALTEADPDFIAEFYPEGGLKFNLTTGFPSRLAHIFDTGKARSASDALTVEGLEGWGPLQAGALRLALQYDQSFTKGGIVPWGQWRRLLLTNTELVKAATGAYSGVTSNTKIVSRAYTQSRVTRSASMVAQFLIERDNPGGNPRNGRTNESFWRGVCGDDTMQVGDPRMALIRVGMRTGAKYRNDNGPTMLAHLLKGYANYMMGTKRVERSEVSKDVPMVRVWQPGMRWFGKELRFPKVGSQGE